MKKISDTDLNNLNELVSIEKIRKIIEILRDPDKGCPWDIKQDYQSLAPYSIEEAYELVNAIETNDINNIKNELGDLLLQVVLISQVASDKGDFNFDDVANQISHKIIRRHPQIFDHKYSKNDFAPYIAPKKKDLIEAGVEVHYLGYYIKWHPQAAYYFAVENGGFEAAPERNAGTYSKYHSLDDKIDDFHFYTTFVKFGIGIGSIILYW
mgnify:CR=1 FL=1